MSGWRVFQLSALEHVNVVEGRQVVPGGPTRQWVEHMRETYGEGSSMYQARVLGQFPSEGVDSLFRRFWVDRAVASWNAGLYLERSRNSRHVVAVDPARYGPDATACCFYRPPVVEAFTTWRKTGTMETVRQLKRELGERRIEDADVVVDSVGVGAGVVDRLKDVRREDPTMAMRIRRVHSFNGGRRARKPSTFFNRRAESYWALRDVLEAGEMSMPPDDELREELLSIRWQATPSGKVQIEAKDDLKDRIGRSPDKADALAMAVHITTTGNRARGGALVPM